MPNPIKVSSISIAVFILAICILNFGQKMENWEQRKWKDGKKVFLSISVLGKKEKMIFFPSTVVELKCEKRKWKLYYFTNIPVVSEDKKIKSKKRCTIFNLQHLTHTSHLSYFSSIFLIWNDMFSWIRWKMTIFPIFFSLIPSKSKNHFLSSFPSIPSVLPLFRCRLLTRWTERTT